MKFCRQDRSFRPLRETETAGEPAERFSALLAQLDRIADRPDAFEPLEWDELGLPK